jgi:hypothetical protein
MKTSAQTLKSRLEKRVAAAREIDSLPVYDITKTWAGGNLHSRALNANVLTATFPSTKGEHVADLYGSPNECDMIVYNNTCPPVGATFKRKIKVYFYI